MHRGDWGAGRHSPDCCLCADVLVTEPGCSRQRAAEIRAGELLAEMEKNKGTRGQLRGEDPGGRIVQPPGDPTPKLSDLGITKSQSSRWQQLVVAALSDNTGRKLTDEE
jgi:hypothetical protein